MINRGSPRLPRPCSWGRRSCRRTFGRRRVPRAAGGSPPDAARATQMITEFGEERQRRLILDYFGGNARVRLLRRDADLRLAGFRRRFRPRRAAFPHPGLVWQQHPGDRAVEHGSALPGAAGVSLRAADVAGAGDEPAGGHGAVARCRRCRDVAVHARLSARLRDHPGRCRRDDRLDRAPLVLSDPAGNDRAGAAIRRDDDRPGSMRSSSTSTIRRARPRATSYSGRAASTRSPPAAASPTTGRIFRSTRRSGRWPMRWPRSPRPAVSVRFM